MIRKPYIFTFILVLGFALYPTDGFADADGGFADGIFIPADGFVFPTPEGEGDLQDTLEYQRVPEQIIGTADFEKMRDLATDSQDYKLGRKVGLIVTRTRDDPKRAYFCTGFLVGPDLFMTNHHCVHDDQGVLPFEKTVIYMNYYQELDVDPTGGGPAAGVSEILHAHARKDYVLLRLDKRIGDTYGWLELDTTTVVDTSQSVKIIQHPQGRSKEIVRKNSQIAGIIAQTPFIVGYLADTQKGSSGSPVFLKDGTDVIAIHHSAWSDANYNPLFNAGSLMSSIVPEIQQWLPGGTPVDPPTPPTPPAPPARPDLVVAAPQVSKGTLHTGESFTLSATVKNQGDAVAEATTLRFYRSTDTSITTADVEVGTAVVRSLAPSESSKASLTLTAPVSPGTYDYGACVDAVNNEGVTRNNCSTAVRITVSTAPDLVVAAPQVSKEASHPGESFTLSATVKNQGNAASQATTLRFYRSTDTTITTSDVEVGTGVVSSLAPSETSEASLTLTAPTVVGTYYYGGCVDAVANEDVTDNNCSTAATLTVSTAPDLVVVAPQVSKGALRAGESFTLSATVKNQGNAASQATTLRFYRSTDTTITTSDVEVGTGVVSSLAPSETSEASLTLTAPTVVGTYYYGGCVDAVANEDVTDNNCSTAATLTVSTAPDLVVVAPQVSKGALRAGESFTLSATVKNQGNAASQATTLRFYRSTDTTITTSDVEVGTGVVSSLAPSETSKVRFTLTVPASVGTYYYGGCVDAVANEGVTDNNCSVAVTITVSVGFNPRTIVDQTFKVGSSVALTLPVAVGGTAPYIYTLSPIPEGLDFDGETRKLVGIPTRVSTTEVTYTATDATGASAALIFTIEVSVASGLDVNGDGQVNVIDLVIVAMFYGTQVPAGASLPADVNEDKIVNILDLTAVAQGIDAGSDDNGFSLAAVEAALAAAAEQAGDLEDVAAAPMRFSTRPDILSSGNPAYLNVAAALADARHLAISDVLSAFLVLLTEMAEIPETTALLPNYPNPFNPETWIPYHLATDAEVILTIHDVHSGVVRELTLGHQPAGVYESRGRAAYWDGKNQLGESVASGVYFYTLKVGEFTATRKMLIRK